MCSARFSVQTALLLALSSLLTGCIGDDEAIIFVEPSVNSPEASIAGSVLGSTVTGAFQLRLVLGPRASGSSTVAIGSVNITDAENKTAVVSGLSLVTSQSFPLTVAPSSDVKLDVTFDMGDKTVPMTTVDALCKAPGVRIAGTIDDSLQDAATPFASDVFAVTGCP